MKYKVGDRVIGIAKTCYGRDIKGLKGTVIIARRDDDICVEFDKNICGHNGDGNGKHGHCWWMNGLTHAKKCSVIKSKIVITTDGEETLARLYEGGKVVSSATAKCASEDEFNFNVGARLAFERLIEYTAVKKEEYFNGKAVCTMGGSDFTVGKIYEFVDGKTKDNDGHERPTGERLKKLEDYNGCLYHFIQYVE